MQVRLGFQRQADQQFCVGESYRLAPIEDRSDISHNHEFAWLREAWASLPEALSDQFPSPAVLRKWALIRAGYCDVTDHVCQFKTEAARTAVLLSAQTDDYAIIAVEDKTVRVFKARSQSRKAMDKAEFQASKTAIMDVIAGLLDVEPEALADLRAAA